MADHSVSQPQVFDDLIRQLLVERYAPRPKRADLTDTADAQAARRRALIEATRDFTYDAQTTEQKRAAKRRRHLRRVA